MKQGPLVAESVKNYTNYIKQNATRHGEYFNSLQSRLFMAFFVCKIQYRSVKVRHGTSSACQVQESLHREKKKKELSTEVQLISFHIFLLFGLVVQGKMKVTNFSRIIQNFPLLAVPSCFRNKPNHLSSRATFPSSSVGGGPGLTVGFPIEYHKMATASRWRPASCSCWMRTQAS